METVFDWGHFGSFGDGLYPARRDCDPCIWSRSRGGILFADRGQIRTNGQAAANIGSNNAAARLLYKHWAASNADADRAEMFYWNASGAMMDDFAKVQGIRKKQQELRDLLKKIKKINARRHPIKSLRMLARAKRLDQELKQEIQELQFKDDYYA